MPPLDAPAAVLVGEAGAAGGEAEVVAGSRAMATDVTVRARAGYDPVGVEEAVGRALRVFADVERTCTRFDPASPLMLANARHGRWSPVPRVCFDALVEAHRAYERTGGRFDPRVLTDLVALGYDRSLPFADGGVALSSRRSPRRAPAGRWRPRFDGSGPRVLIGDRPVDLGGIGKGLAVRWAAAVLRAASADHLVEAGGDMWCGGRAPDGGPWRVGVEDPRGGDGPAAVLAVSDRACATSSVRLRRWKTGGRDVHHLIDPRHGRPGGGGLLSVTVVGSDPAECEVWAKVLFLAGRSGVAGLARRRRLAALWIDTSGRMTVSPALDANVMWRAA